MEKINGDDVIVQSLKTRTPKVTPPSFGSLILQIIEEGTSYREVQEIMSMAVSINTSEARAYIEQLLDVVSEYGKTSEFWKLPPDEALVVCQTAAMQVMKEQGIEPNRRIFDVSFALVVFNFVGTLLQSSSSKGFVQKAIGISFFSRIFS